MRTNRRSHRLWLLSLVAVCLGLWALALPARATGSGTVTGWGRNVEGQATPPGGLTGVVAIAAGYSHSLALKSDGTVVGWGTNGHGETTAPEARGITRIAAGTNFSLALTIGGTVLAWGDDSSGQTDVPAGLTGVAAIAAGDSHALALKTDGTVVTWGYDGGGELEVPSGLTGVVAIAAGAYHSMALKSDGTVVAWGQDTNGQTEVPSGLAGVKAIAAGTFHSLALKSDGTVVAWGLNGAGVTTVPAGLSGVTAISGGTYHNLAVSGGSVVAWGLDADGQIDVPAGLTGVTSVAAGGSHSLALPGIPDTTPPTLSRSSVGTTGASNGLPYLPITVRDGGSGVSQVQLTANSTNCHLESPLGTRLGPTRKPRPFTMALPVASGTARVYVVADKDKPTRVEVRAVDAAGNTGTINAAFARLQIQHGTKRSLTISRVVATDRYFTLRNGTPGLGSAQVWVNGTLVSQGSLTPGQTVPVDVAAAMRAGKPNRVKITATGAPASQALLTLSSDPPGA